VIRSSMGPLDREHGGFRSAVPLGSDPFGGSVPSGNCCPPFIMSWSHPSHGHDPRLDQAAEVKSRE
jgi:hypothetical protein